MDICISEKKSKNLRCKTVSLFNEQGQELFQNYLTHETIQRLVCVVGYFNEKSYRKLI